MKPTTRMRLIAAIVPYAMAAGLMSATGCHRVAGRGPDPAGIPPPAPIAAATDTFELRVGESRVPVFGGPRVGFLGVREDSRCPRDVTCVWEGRAIVALFLMPTDRDSVIVAATLGGNQVRTPPTHTPLDTLGVHLSLLQLDPYPFSKTPTRPSDYRARLAVSKL